MYKKIKLLFFISLFVTFAFSCQKACDFPDEDIISGDIIADGNVLGFNSGGVKSVHHSADPINPMTVSFDKGYTYVPIDFSKYTVMNFPILAGCNVHFGRDVKINSATGKVTYTLTVDTCPDCEEQYLQDNWVLVRAFPVNYQVVYTKK